MNVLFAFQATNPDISWSLIGPELIIGIAAVVVMMIDAFARRDQRWLTGAASLAALILAGGVFVWPSGALPAHPASSKGTNQLEEIHLELPFIFPCVLDLAV